MVIQPPNGRLRDGHFSPNGLYFVFVSDESGRDEVYVQAMPPASFRTKISINGGILPRWRADGKELFFISSGSTMMSVDVNTVGRSRPVYRVSYSRPSRAESRVWVCGPQRRTAVPDAGTRHPSRDVADYGGAELVDRARVRRIIA